MVGDLPIGNKYTPYGTPLHVSQLFRIYLEQTFRSFDEDHPFRATDDWNTSGVVFDTVFNKESEVHGAKPLIIVSSNGYTYGNLSQGDLAAAQLTSMQVKHTSLITSGTVIKVIGDNYGTVDILANEVFNMLITARTLLPRMTTIHQIVGISVSPISTFDEGDHMYFAQIDVSYLLQYQWTLTVPELILESIALNTSQRNNAENNRNTIIT